MRYCLNIARLNMLRWKTSLRIIMLLCLLAVMQIMYALPYMENARGFGYPVQIFETYIATFSGAHASILISIVVVFILADVPVRNNGFELALVRGNRGKWLAGQWLYILACAFFLCCIILAFNLLISAPYSYLPNEWSLPTQISTNSGKSALGLGQLFSIIPKYIIDNNSPNGAMLFTFLLQFLLFVFFGSFSVLLNLLTNRIIAPVILILLNAIHWLLRMFVPGDPIFKTLSWFSPLYHGTFSEHQFHSISSGGMASPTLSALILVGCSVLFIIAAHWAVRKNDILNYTGGDFDA